MDERAELWNKSEWRSRMRAVRDALPPRERAALSERSCERLSERILKPMRAALNRPLRVAAYAAFRSEADPVRLMADCLAQGDALLAPRILPGGEGMELRRVEALTSWVPGRWGVPEPDPGTTVPWETGIAPDVVLVPGLAFDEFGGRLGYGGGYYDRLYETLRGNGETPPGRWIGFAYEQQVVAWPIPAEPHDLRLDALATDAGVRTFAGRTMDGGGKDA